MPQYSYGAQPRFTLGQEATLSPCSKDSYLNPLLPQIDTVAFAGGGSGDYTILIRGEEGDFPVTVNAAPATAADFVSAFNGDPDLDLIVTAADVAGDLVLTFSEPGRPYSVLLTENPSSDMSLTATQAAGGPSLPLGAAVAFSSTDPESAVEGVSGSTVAADIAGVTVRNEAIELNRGNFGGFTGTDEFVAGEVVTVGRQGEFVIQVEDAVTAGAACFVRSANPPQGSVLGAFRSDAAGGDAFVLPFCRFRTSTDGPGLAVITINLP